MADANVTPLHQPVQIDASDLIRKYQEALTAQQQAAFVAQAHADALARQNEVLAERVATLEEQLLERADEG